MIEDNGMEQPATRRGGGSAHEASRLGGRRRSRELALQVLYQLDATAETDWRAAFEVFCGSFEAPEPLKEFALRLVGGVRERLAELDALIGRHSENWRLERMSRVDRNILRMAAFELLYCQDIPPRVTLNEAIDLGKRYGTEDSGAFINGILDNIYASQGRQDPGPQAV